MFDVLVGFCLGLFLGCMSYNKPDKHESAEQLLNQSIGSRPHYYPVKATLWDKIMQLHIRLHEACDTVQGILDLKQGHLIEAIEDFYNVYKLYVKSTDEYKST